MSKAPKKEKDGDTPESDAFPGARHPRYAPRLIGHAVAETELLNGYRSGRLAHAWLIGGREGIGKATLAWRFARFLLANPNPEAPAVVGARDLSVPAHHPVVRQIEALSHPDFAIVRRGWNEKTGTGFFTEIRIDDVREQMHVFHMSAAFGGWRIAIVDAADDLNRNSANALLKIIEEPPPKSLILILAHRMGAVMPTIRSRCRRLMLEPLSVENVAEIVTGLGPPWTEAGRDRIAAAARQANGSVREALQRLEPESQTIGAMIEAAIAKLPGGDARLNQRLAEAVSGRGAEEHFERLKLALFDWIAGEARKPSSSARLETLSDLWSLLRANAREADALNLDKRATVMAAFEEIISRSRALG